MPRSAPFLASGLLLLVCAGCLRDGVKTSPRAPAADPGTLVLRGVHVFAPASGTMSGPQDILIADGRVRAVGTRLAVPAGTPEIDCQGQYALPGLFDCHTHLIHLTGHGDEELKARLADFVAHGVTQVRDVGGPIGVLSGLHRRIAAGEIAGPEIFYTGPMLEGSPLSYESMNEEFPGFTVAIDTPADVDLLVPELARQGACAVKTFNHIDPTVYRHLVDVAREHGLRIVHDPGTPLFHRVPMDVAIELGVTSIEHAKAPWPVVLRDELRDEHDALAQPDANEMAQMVFMMRTTALGVDSVSLERVRQLADHVRETGTYLCPTLLVFAALEDVAIEQVKQHQHLDEVPEMMRAGIRQGIAAMQQVSRVFVREFADRGVRMLVGQDGADPAGTLAEMRWLSEWGVPQAEILRGATIYPAQWLGVEDRLGSLTPGKEANVLVVRGNPLADIGQLETIVLVVHHGRIVRR